MTPEERKAIAMRHAADGGYHEFRLCKVRYPECCSFHEGFDAALALVTEMVYEGRRHYAIEDTP